MTINCFLGCTHPGLRVKPSLPFILRAYEIPFRTPEGGRGSWTCGSVLANGQWLSVVDRVVDRVLDRGS